VSKKFRHFFNYGRRWRADGTLQDKNYNLGVFWEGLGMDNVGIFSVIWYNLLLFCKFCVHLVWSMAIWHILLPSGIFYGHLVYFCWFGMSYQEKSCNAAKGEHLWLSGRVMRK
jgi:hypothetical protein